MQTEFKAKLDRMANEWLPCVSNPMTVNELVWVLRHDYEVSDYMLNINSKKEGFTFGFLKESFMPSRTLALKIKSIEYEWIDGSEYPLLYIETN